MMGRQLGRRVAHTGEEGREDAMQRVGSGGDAGRGRGLEESGREPIGDDLGIGKDAAVDVHRDRLR